ncbi:MAG: hypothetical protein ACJA1A_002619 [Saprospiraceae bacterium]|jgi:hypothetical protein
MFKEVKILILALVTLLVLISCSLVYNVDEIENLKPAAIASEVNLSIYDIAVDTIPDPEEPEIPEEEPDPEEEPEEEPEPIPDTIGIWRMK